MAQYSRKLKSGIRWWYKFAYLGTTYFSKAIYLSKSEARKAENAKYDEVSTSARNGSLKPILSLTKAINERLDTVKAKKSISYYNDNRRYYKILLNSLGDIQISDIYKADIEKILSAASEKQKSKGGDNYVVNAMLASYKALFNHAINGYDLNIKNPCKGIKPFPVNKHLKYIPKDEDIEAVLEKCDDKQKLLINFIKETGARISEALRFSGNDILEDGIVLYTRKSKNSNLVPRKLPKPECLKDIKIKSDEKLFGRWVEQPKFLERKVTLLKQQPWGFHNLRHRYASLLSKQGLPIYEIMSKLGHSNITTTQIYLQLL